MLADREEQSEALSEQRLGDRFGAPLEQQQRVLLAGKGLEQLAQKVVQNGGERSRSQRAAVDRRPRQNLEHQEFRRERVDRNVGVSSDAEPLRWKPNVAHTVLNTVQTSVGWHFVSGSVRGFQPL